eukprot:gnl/MRDRNA2_/MRDRNA2_140848_c0_seq1.p1 gnl/MRDRNA2_/MRDRNA2_140848_c0~~gnl/MRDRNA2_/MRDRNA2_140848_c0_seq1.p1  ORF type:complete len:261 (+),score=36.13 gnl/MRDRNA2_/MRDRNA2_140848_c0_seq1:97-879(+)
MDDRKGSKLPKKRGSIELPSEIDVEQKPLGPDNERSSTVKRIASTKSTLSSNMDRLQDMLSRTIELDSPTISRHASGSMFRSYETVEPDSPTSPMSPMSPMSPTVFRPGTDRSSSRSFMLRKNQSVPELASPAASTIAGRSRKRGSFQDGASIKAAQRFSQLQSSSSSTDTQTSGQLLSKWVSGERFARADESNREVGSTMNIRQLMKLDDRINIDEMSMKNYQTSHNEDEEEMFNRSMRRQNSKMRHTSSYRHVKTIER